MSKSIQAPWTDEQVTELNNLQSSNLFHGYTCCSAGSLENCERRNNTGEGMLKATNEGWICPCGEYSQNWAHGDSCKIWKITQR